MMLAWPVYVGMSFFAVFAAFFGVYVVLRRMSLMTDVLSHATLPGVVLGFCLFQGSYLCMLVGGMLSGFLGVLLTGFLERHSFLKMDAILGVILSIFFGFGLFLYSFLQRYAGADQAMIMRFLLGNPVLLTRQDCIYIVGLGIIVFFVCATFYKPLQLIAFDRLYAACLGYNIVFYDFLLLFFLLAIISLGLPLVGVMLTSSLMVAPAMVGLQFCSRIRAVQIVAMLVAFFGSGLGLLLSASFKQIPAGPLISIFVISAALFSIAYCSFKSMYHSKKG
ncbi:metal ABC transporter permease [bacterium]|nr:MAG: metal ABC transporter permease [bacterium]QQR61571.1 MAG: metal ABC transporter permease [bacterium]QQR62893.1 MAG: metal ABC transporter permease [bacterium]